MKKFSTVFFLWSLTYVKSILRWIVLQPNITVVPKRGALPAVALKGIIIMTLVIGREFKGSTVKRGAFVMFKLFKVKKQIEIQLEEYIEFKARTSPFMAQDQKEILTIFIRDLKCVNVSQITQEQIEIYYNKVSQSSTGYTTERTTQALRSFMRFHKVKTDIKPKHITNTGMELQSVGKSDTIPPMNRPKMGRPVNIELVKKVKALKDVGHLSYREISKVVKSPTTGKPIDVKHVYQMYNYDLKKLKRP